MNFEQLMKIPGNEVTYNALTNQIEKHPTSVIPFIGAGMSASFGYKNWENFLLNACNNLKLDIDSSKQIKTLISNNRYEKAASKIIDLAGLSFYDYFKTEFNDDKYKKVENLNLHPIHLLPNIFESFYITTNYDRIIENSFTKFFNGNRLMEVYHPNHKEILNGVLRNTNDNAILYKFHGCVSEPSNIILSEEQYDINYAKNTNLSNELKLCFKSKIILFLGCSLNVDRTMDVLKEILEPGIENFCIISCDEDKYNERRNQLNTLGIKPIFYPSGKHECLYIILSTIASRVNSSFRNDMHFSKADSYRKFEYNSNYIEFVERDNEIDALIKFCNSQQKHAWWAITGEGGTGKSRITYELSKNIEDSWDIYHYENYTTRQLLLHLTNIRRNTLFILDHVGVKCEAITELICNMCNSKSQCKIRVLFIDRNNIKIIKNKGTITNIIKPSWLENLEASIGFSVLERLKYKVEFLYLNPLSNDAILKIIRNFANKKGVLLEDKECSLIQRQLFEIDEKLCRPLYAMLLTEAYCEGHVITEHSMTDILDFIIINENSIIESNLNSIDINAIDSINVYKELLVIATMTNGLDIGNCNYKYINELAEKMKVNRVGLNSFHRASLIQGDIINALQPDIIGEYYCIKIFKTIQNPTIKNAIVAEAWDNPSHMSDFIIRLFEDYKSILEHNPDMYTKLFDIVYTDGNIDLIAYTLSNIMHIVEGDCEIYFEKLFEKLLLEYPHNPNVKKHYAVGLHKSIYNSGFNKKEISLVNLEKLHIANKENYEIAEVYARGLAEFSYHLRYVENGDIEKVVQKLESLVADYDYKMILIFYAGALVNSMIKQTPEEMKITLDKLNELHNRYPSDGELAAIYTKGLVSIATELDEKQAEESAKKIEALFIQNPDNPDIAESCFLFGFNRMIDTKITSKRIETIGEKYKKDVEFAHSAVDKIFNYEGRLSDKNKAQIINLAQAIEILAKKYINSKHIVGPYASSLAFLSLIQKLAQAEETINKFKLLTKRFPFNDEIITIYAKVLVELSDRQDIKKARKTFEEIKALTKKYSYIEDMERVYRIASNNLKNRSKKS